MMRMKKTTEQVPYPAAERETTLEERKQLIRDALERGLENDDQEIVAFHGTSLETLHEVLRTGRFVGTTQNDTAHKIDGKSVPVFSVFALNSPTAREASHTDDEDFEMHLVKEARDYATTIAERHAFLRELGIPISERYNLLDLNDICFGRGDKCILDEDMCDEFIEKAGTRVPGVTLTKDQIRAAIIRAHTRKGVTLGFKKALFQDFPVYQVGKETNDESYEAVIHCPEGIPLSYLIGVDPYTKEELQELEKAVE